MEITLKMALPYILSVVSLYATYLAGNKNPKAWIFKIASQAIWFVWIINSKEWGFIPMNIVMWGMYIRNYIKWNREIKHNLRKAI